MSIDFDRVLKHIGPLGRWQVFNLSMLFSVTLCGGIAVVTFAFAAFEPNYRCSIPQCENVSDTTYLVNNEAYVNMTLTSLGYEV